MKNQREKENAHDPGSLRRTRPSDFTNTDREAHSTTPKRFLIISQAPPWCIGVLSARRRPAADEHRWYRPIPLCSKIHSDRDAGKESSLPGRQPVAHSYAETLGDFHPAYARLEHVQTDCIGSLRCERNSSGW